MTDFARARLAEPVAAFSAANKLPSDNPNGASAPTRTKSRRDHPLQNPLFFPLNETSSMAFSKVFAGSVSGDANLDGTAHDPFKLRNVGSRGQPYPPTSRMVVTGTVVNEFLGNVGNFTGTQMGKVEPQRQKRKRVNKRTLFQRPVRD